MPIQKIRCIRCGRDMLPGDGRIVDSGRVCRLCDTVTDLAVALGSSNLSQSLARVTKANRVR